MYTLMIQSSFTLFYVHKKNFSTDFVEKIIVDYYKLYIIVYQYKLFI